MLKHFMCISSQLYFVMASFNIHVFHKTFNVDRLLQSLCHTLHINTRKDNSHATAVPAPFHYTSCYFHSPTQCSSAFHNQFHCSRAH